MARTRTEIDLLRGVDLFEELSKSELRKVAGLAKPFTFVEGESVTEGLSPGSGGDRRWRSPTGCSSAR
jgi:hypothetical protein